MTQQDFIAILGRIVSRAAGIATSQSDEDKQRLLQDLRADAEQLQTYLAKKEKK